MFIESNVQISQGYSEGKWEYETKNTGDPYQTEEKSTSNNFRPNAELLVGIGRIEPVEDMRLAIYILEELQKAKRLKRVPTKAEIIEFAELISTLRNERFFDSRLKRIHELEQLDTFLVSKDLISDYDATHFAIIMDNWDYAAGPDRNAGWRISTGIGGSINWNKMESISWTNNYMDFTSNSDYTRSQLRGILNLIYAKPVNLYWQIDFGIQLIMGTDMYGKDKIFVLDSDVNKFIIVSPYCSVGYYPNSRSSYRLSLSPDYYNRIDENPQYLSLDFIIGGNYYISQQLRLNFGIHSYFKHGESQTGSFLYDDYKNGFNYSAHVDLTYSIL